MFITLTNAHPDHKGNPIAIKKELIVVVYPTVMMRPNGIGEQVTIVHCPPHGSWEVEESFEDVIDMMSWNAL